MKLLKSSMGRGKMIVEFFSAEMPVNVWRYLSCIALGDSARIREACFNASAAFCSPSAAITYKKDAFQKGCQALFQADKSPLLWLLSQPRLQQPWLFGVAEANEHLLLPLSRPR
jgi:hypothetical protein